MSLKKEEEEEGEKSLSTFQMSHLLKLSWKNLHSAIRKVFLNKLHSNAWMYFSSYFYQFLGQIYSSS